MCVYPHKLHSQCSSQSLLNTPPVELPFPFRKSQSPHSTYTRPDMIHSYLAANLSLASSPISVFPTSTSHSAPATLASLLLLKHGNWYRLKTLKCHFREPFPNPTLPSQHTLILKPCIIFLHRMYYHQMYQIFTRLSACSFFLPSKR